jgi:demethylmenaquinone methyltransferase/2-methoxy-6-polyprenyl-1,4-benzoquinol methylase
VTDARVVETAALFDRSAAYYDHVNTIICMGADLRWRRWAAQRALATAPARKPTESSPDKSLAPRVLDAFGGTGLVALELARRGAHVTLADVSPGMLRIARGRAARRGLSLDVVVTDLTSCAAAELPGAPYDAITVAFGLRYVDDPAGLLRGLGAALAPGGAIVLLEAVVPRGGLVAALAGAYFFEVAPRVGTLLAGRGELYAQLTSTVRALGGAGDVLAHVRAAGLLPQERRLFAGGVVAGVVARLPSGMVSSPAST